MRIIFATGNKGKIVRRQRRNEFYVKIEFIAGKGIFRAERRDFKRRLNEFFHFFAQTHKRVGFAVCVNQTVGFCRFIRPKNGIAFVEIFARRPHGKERVFNE